MHYAITAFFVLEGESLDDALQQLKDAGSPLFRKSPGSVPRIAVLAAHPATLSHLMVLDTVVSPDGTHIVDKNLVDLPQIESSLNIDGRGQPMPVYSIPVELLVSARSFVDACDVAGGTMSLGAPAQSGGQVHGLRVAVERMAPASVVPVSDDVLAQYNYRRHDSGFIEGPKATSPQKQGDVVDTTVRSPAAIAFGLGAHADADAPLIIPDPEEPLS